MAAFTSSYEDMRTCFRLQPLEETFKRGAVMLVRGRKPGETIVVPETGITVTILEVSTSRVPVGITSPSDMKTWREKHWKNIDSTSQGKEPDVTPPPGITD
jgi:sRNA-binding carbon storage regulator CsrA